MTSDLIVRGGTVVDGTGSAGRTADVRVRDGVIVEVAPDLALDGEREVDARGAIVTPSLIDSHPRVATGSRVHQPGPAPSRWRAS